MLDILEGRRSRCVSDGGGGGDDGGDGDGGGDGSGWCSRRRGRRRRRGGRTKRVSRGRRGGWALAGLILLPACVREDAQCYNSIRKLRERGEGRGERGEGRGERGEGRGERGEGRGERGEGGRKEESGSGGRRIEVGGEGEERRIIPVSVLRKNGEGRRPALARGSEGVDHVLLAG